MYGLGFLSRIAIEAAATEGRPAGFYLLEQYQ
jgi:hypothetical protein